MRTRRAAWVLMGLAVGCGAGNETPLPAEEAEVVVAARADALGGWTGGDPCDFTTAEAFGYDQVLACYRSVPWCPDPSNPATCDRDAQVAHFKQAMEGFSDLRGTYEARYHWREKLEAISRARFRSDYQQYLAFSELLADFRSDHWYYLGPDCFEFALFEVIPVNFGSMLADLHGRHGPEQIIYLRDAAPEGGGGFDLSGFRNFYQRQTGIDVSAFTGQRVVRIQGEEPLEFFRRWGRTALREDDDDGINLMSILDEAGFTFRSGSFNPFPESATLRLLLEDGAGKRTRVELPWVFVPSAAAGFPVPVPASSAEFQALCFLPSAAAGASTAAAGPSAGPKRDGFSRGSLLREPKAHLDQLARRRAWASAAPSIAGRSDRRRPRGDFAEVPPEQLGQDIVEVFPLSDGSRTVAYADDTVAIQIRSGFGSDWDEELDQGARYACDHARRLIIDVRGNLGGFVSRLQRAARYLNAGHPALPNSVLGFRDLARSPELAELRALSEKLVGLGFPACFAGYEAACFVSIPSGQLETDPSWYRRETVERRGHRLEHLTPLVSLQPNVPSDDFVIPCPGKFVGENLVVLLNGLNSSAAFFFPELLRGVGTLAVQGGFQDEAMTTGRARGGPTVWTFEWSADLDFLTGTVDVAPQHALPALPRPVSFRLEHQAFYRQDEQTLHVDHPPTGNVQVPFWSNTEESDGAAYRAVVSAVVRQARLDPVCGRAERARHCHEYRQCASAVLDGAVSSGQLSPGTAERTLEDAVAACRAD